MSAPSRSSNPARPASRPEPRPDRPPAPPTEAMRLQKFLAEAGVASRRAAERLILAGRVRVNGEPVGELGRKVNPARDQVAVDGRVVRRKKRLHVALHKPPGYVCTRTPQGRQPGVLELLPAEWSGLYPVGRLDRESEGLLLLTNDGDFCVRLTHPRHGVRKVYEATVNGRVTPPMLEPLCRGLRHRGERLQAESARVLTANSRRSRVELVLREGKNREVRRLFAAIGLQVTRLLRVRIGPLRLGELPPGKWRVLPPAEVTALLRSATAPAGH